jgi:hypothetical protein
MKLVSENATALLEEGSFDYWYVADLWYDGARRLAEVPIGNVQLGEDDSRGVKGSGSCVVTWSDDFGASITPDEIGDLFAPFGSELAIYAILSGRGTQERIPMGWYQIVDVPSMRDSTMFFGGRTVTTGSVLELKLMDRLIQTQLDEFDVPTAPRQLGSVWQEIATLTGLQIVRSLPDAPISRAVAYQDSKLGAVLDLADILGGIPYMRPDGALSMRPKVWGDPVARLTRGDEGTLVDVARGISADGVYNKIVFRGQDELQGQVLASVEILDGPLRTVNRDGTRSPAHRRPTFRSNEFVTTREQAFKYVSVELPRVSTLSAVKWPVVEIWNPTRELGDVLTLVDEQEREQTCRVVAIDRSPGATQKVTVIRGEL